MPEIKLTPTGQLRWVLEGPSTSLLVAVGEVFERDWREGLFVLSAEKHNPADSKTLRYWQNIANRYLTELCHIPESQETISVASPGEG
ncbi:MAG: hypothetical protein DRP56_05385, partial [Planctomycetota bacterium]